MGEEQKQTGEPVNPQHPDEAQPEKQDQRDTGQQDKRPAEGGGQTGVDSPQR